VRKVAEGDACIQEDASDQKQPHDLKQPLDVIKGVAMRMRAHSAGEVLRGLRGGRRSLPT